MNNWIRINDMLMNLNFATKIKKKHTITNDKDNYFVYIHFTNPNDIIQLEFESNELMEEYFNMLIEKLVYSNVESENKENERND